MGKKAKGLFENSEGNSRNQATVVCSEKILVLEQRREMAGKEIKEIGGEISKLVEATSRAIKTGLYIALFNLAVECAISYSKRDNCKGHVEELMELVRSEKFILPLLQNKDTREKSLFEDIEVLEHLVETEFREALIDEIIDWFISEYNEDEISDIDSDIESLLKITKR